MYDVIGEVRLRCDITFLAPVWGVGVVRGAGRRGSVACGVAQRALLCAFMFVLCIDVLFVF